MRISYMITIHVQEGSYLEDLRLYDGGGIMLNGILENQGAGNCTEIFWLDKGLRESRGEQSNKIIFSLYLAC